MSRTNGPTSTSPRTRSGRSTDAHTAPCGHRVADEDGRAAEVLGQRQYVAAGGDIVVRRERGVAVSVAAQVHRRDPVTRVDQARCQEAVDRSQIAEPGAQTTSGPSPVTS